MGQQLEISDYQSADHAVLQDLVIRIAEQVEYLHISTQEALTTYARKDTSPYNRRFLAELNGELVGFAQLSWQKLRRSCHVGRIDVVVLQQFKGMDIEDELMIHCEFIAGELGLTRLEMKAIQTDFDSVQLGVRREFRIESKEERAIRSQNRYLDCYRLAKFI